MIISSEKNSLMVEYGYIYLIKYFRIILEIGNFFKNI